MPMYGRSFTLADANQNGLNSAAWGGKAGDLTASWGFLSYYEVIEPLHSPLLNHCSFQICDRIENHNWNVVRDPQGRMGPYAYNGNQWVGFDDSAMIERKSNYIGSEGLGGAMIWALDLDDFNNV